jgi:hypothetical protein
MKSSYLRAATALACALGLSACGGSSGNFQLGGYAYGVTKTGLVLQNNNGSDLKVDPSPTGVNPVPFVFGNLIDVDASYNVAVKDKPSNAETCVVTNATGHASFNVTNIVVTCTLKMHKLTGAVNGLGSASGLVVVNGQDRVTILPGATTFAMTPVGEDQPYGITVLAQPAGLTCTVAQNGVGTMGTADIANVVINCVPAA